jgi:hypothetical protein
MKTAFNIFTVNIKTHKVSLWKQVVTDNYEIEFLLEDE